MRLATALFVSLGTLGLSLLPSVAPAWEAHVRWPDSGGPECGERERVEDLRLDPAGNIVAYGRVGCSYWRCGWVKLSSINGQEIWRRHCRDPSLPLLGAIGLGIDAAGDVVGAGALDLGDHLWPGISAFKLSGSSGELLWRSDLATDVIPATPRAVALDPSGAMVVVGQQYRSGMVVAKIAGDGSVLWRVDRDESQPGISGLWADGAGDFLAIGTTVFRRVTVGGFEFKVCEAFVTKLSGVDGSEIWRIELPGEPLACEVPRALTRDGAGDLVLAVNTQTIKRVLPDISSETTETAAVHKLSGVDGSLVWTRPVVGTLDPGRHSIQGLALGPTGRVAVAAETQNLGTGSDFTVLALSAVDGAELWRTEIHSHTTTNPGDERATRVAFDSAGNVVAAGRLKQSLMPGGLPGAMGYVHRFLVVKLAGSDGSELWRRKPITLPRILRWPHRENQARALAGTAEDDVIAGGRIVRHRPGFGDWTVVRLRGEDGADLRPMAGGRLFLRDHAVDPSNRRLFLRSSDGRVVVADGVGQGGAGATVAELVDDPHHHGATLEILNPQTGESDLIPLPASLWEPILLRKAIAGVGGWRYLDLEGTAGPCRRVVIRTRRRIRALCAGDGLGFTLDEAAQTRLVAKLTIGPVQYCMDFGGQVLEDESTSTGEPRGVFEATGAPRPTDCSFSPP